MKKGDNSEQRQSFTFYLSFEKAISKLEDTDQLTIYRAIARYSLFGEEPKNLDGFAQLAWDLLEPTLKKSRTNFLNGRNGGAPIGNRNNRFSDITTESTTEKQANYNRKHNTDTDTDTETDSVNYSNQRLESKKPSAFSPSVRLKLEHSDFVCVQTMWNECCPTYRRVTKLTSKSGKRCNRKGNITVCLNMLAEEAKNGSKSEALKMLRSVFEKVAKSKFLSGQNYRGWKANFDWVMKPDNLVKVLEGNYDDDLSCTSKSDNINDLWDD